MSPDEMLMFAVEYELERTVLVWHPDNEAPLAVLWDDRLPLAAVLRQVREMERDHQVVGVLLAADGQVTKVPKDGSPQVTFDARTYYAMGADGALVTIMITPDGEREVIDGALGGTLYDEMRRIVGAA